MNGSTFLPIFRRNLEHLKRELEAYDDESDLWTTPGSISNSAGTLALHLVGNLNHFIGTKLGGTGYVRDRDAEFSQRGVPRARMLRSIDDTIDMLESVLPEVDEARLAETTETPFGDSVPWAQWLTHLTGHLGYHLGQLSYHRRSRG